MSSETNGPGRPGRRRTGWWIALAVTVLAVAGIWWWWTAPHRALGARLDRIELPAGLTYVGEYSAGDRICFMGSCPRVSHYYVSDLGIEELCERVETEVDGVERFGSRSERCVYRHPSGVSLTVSGPIEEVPPIENELLNHRPVLVAHRSTLELYLSR
ncbi:MAG: hypothetical protein ACLFWM_06030 [Actinomycetota bacterium]